MNRAEQIASGMMLLAKYEGCETAAEHDIIYSGPDDAESVVSAEDQKQLDELGWHIDSEFGCYARFT